MTVSSSDHGVEVAAATGAHREKRRKLGAPSGTDVAGRSPAKIFQSLFQRRGMLKFKFRLGSAGGP